MVQDVSKRALDDRLLMVIFVNECSVERNRLLRHREERLTDLGEGVDGRHNKKLMEQDGNLNTQIPAQSLQIVTQDQFDRLAE